MPTDPKPLVLFDFEDGTMEGWRTVDGTFPPNPTFTRRTHFNRKGAYFLGSGEISPSTYDDSYVGTLRSPPFVATHDYLMLKISGGDDLNRIFVRLVRTDTEEELYRATGRSREQMHNIIWDLEPVRGHSVYLELVDSASEEWGHVNLDYVRLLDAGG